MIRTLRRTALAACAALVLAACAALPPPAVVETQTSVDTTFRADGRLSARRGNDGVAVHFDWRHAPDRDTFDVATPLGQVVARMQRDASGIRVERPAEPVAEYASWQGLTEAILGVRLPIDGLAAWVQGAPSPGATAVVEHDAAGRAIVLREQGWEIAYSYADAKTRRPVRLVLRYPDSEPIEVRIVIDRWSTPS